VRFTVLIPDWVTTYRDLRILVFSELWYPEGSGAELASHLYCDLLASQGHEIRVVTYSRAVPNQSPGVESRIEVIRLAERVHTGSRYDLLLNGGSLLVGSVRAAIEWSDLVYVPGAWYNALLLAKLKRKPTVAHMHNFALVSRESLHYDFVARKPGRSSLKSFMQHERIKRGNSGLSLTADMFMSESVGNAFNNLSTLSDALVFVSDNQFTTVMKEIPRIAGKSFRVYNPIPDWPLVRCERGGIGYLGGPVVVKGSNVILQSAAMLKRDSDVCLHMTGMEPVPREFRVGNSAIVKYYPRLSRSALASLMKVISVVCVPSLWAEPLPYSVIDAILYGKLVVASRIGGIPEIVEGMERSTALVIPGDVAGLSGAIETFLQLTPNEVNDLGESSREKLRRKFDNEHSAAALGKIMQKVVNDGGLQFHGPNNGKRISQRRTGFEQVNTGAS